MKKFIWIMLFSLLLGSWELQSRPADRKNVAVYVRFQVKSGEKSWGTGTTTLRGVLTESMMRNELSNRYPGRKIRILAARTGKSQAYDVRFRVSKNRKNWSTGTTVLYDAVTESMARNQISQRYPGMAVQILSKTRR